MREKRGGGKSSARQAQLASVHRFLPKRHLPNGHLPKTNAKWTLTKWTFTKKIKIQEIGLLPNRHLPNRHLPNLVNVHYCKQTRHLQNFGSCSSQTLKHFMPFWRRAKFLFWFRVARFRLGQFGLGQGFLVRINLSQGRLCIGSVWFGNIKLG